MPRLSALVLACLLVACGGGAASVEAPARVRPSGPVLTYLHVPHAFLLRVDCSAIRVTPVAADVSALWRASPLFQRLASTGSFDPIRDLDQMVTTTASVGGWRGGPSSSRWRVVLRHHEEPAAARALLAQIASARGEPLAWRQGQGLASAILPGELSHQTPHTIVLTAAHEAVIAPEDEVSSLSVVARDQAARRDAETDPIEPGLFAPTGELVHAETTDPPPVLASLGAVAAQASVVRAGQGAAVHLALDFVTPSAAQALASTASTQLAALAQNAMIAALGLAHPLAVAEVTTADRTVTVDTTASWDELAAALRALALVSAG